MRQQLAAVMRLLHWIMTANVKQFSPSHRLESVGEGEEEVEAAEGVEGAAAKEVEFQGCCSSWQLAMQRNNFAYCIEMQLRFQSQGRGKEKKEVEKEEAGQGLT